MQGIVEILATPMRFHFAGELPKAGRFDSGDFLYSNYGTKRLRNPKLRSYANSS
jgi:hypothetical protein